jgi:hypothetical protein
MQNRYKFTIDMKNILVLSMLISSIMICSCQKQESTAQEQPDQRKVELDAREEALAERKIVLDGREKGLDERQRALEKREKSLAERERAAMNARTNPTDAQTPNPAQMQAERQRVVQQFSGRIPDKAQLQAQKAEKESETEQQRRQSQSLQEEKLKAIESKWHSTGMSSGAVYPAPAATSPPPSSAEEATSPNPSQTPE